MVFKCKDGYITAGENARAVVRLSSSRSFWDQSQSTQSLTLLDCTCIFINIYIMYQLFPKFSTNNWSTYQHDKPRRSPAERMGGHVPSPAETRLAHRLEIRNGICVPTPHFAMRVRADIWKRQIQTNSKFILVLSQAALRSKNRNIRFHLTEKVLAKMTVREALTVLDENDVPCGEKNFNARLAQSSNAVRICRTSHPSGLKLLRTHLCLLV